MTKRKLRAYDPRTTTRDRSGASLHRSTLAMLNEVRAWILAEMWANPSLRPPQWDGKLTQDEALRFVLHFFGETYGVPLNTQERQAPCEQSD